MVCTNQLVLGFLFLQMYVNAAPSETTEYVKEDLKAEEQTQSTADSTPVPIKELKVNNTIQNQRQKRQFFNFGFSPVNPYYPSLSQRDQSSNPGIYDIDDPLTHIHRRLLQIAGVARQPPATIPPVHIPFWLPVLYIPQTGCDCNPKRKPQSRPGKNETGDPSVNNRVPDLEDDRQNWGIANDDEEYDDVDEDFTRPISFDPIMVDRPMKRPPPPVEHGTSQIGDDGLQSTTTVRPPLGASMGPQPSSPMSPPGRPPSGPPMGPSRNDPPRNPGVPQAAPYPPSLVPTERPNVCDAAVLSCCHQVHVTYSCFSLQGCPDPTAYGNPCDPRVILRVVEKYQRFYGYRNG